MDNLYRAVLVAVVCASFTRAAPTSILRQGSCTVQVQTKDSSTASVTKCVLDENFGCFSGNNSMWVAGGCKAVFVCNGVRNVSCESQAGESSKNTRDAPVEVFCKCVSKPLPQTDIRSRRFEIDMGDIGEDSGVYDNGANEDNGENTACGEVRRRKRQLRRKREGVEYGEPGYEPGEPGNEPGNEPGGEPGGAGGEPSGSEGSDCEEGDAEGSTGGSKDSAGDDVGISIGALVGVAFLGTCMTYACGEKK
eukprot:m.11228 g.11228  ORF g.11228 m.11228 type:complete len:250 (-) comp8716_c0_seq1:372-1121(-)